MLAQGELARPSAPARSIRRREAPDRQPARGRGGVVPEDRHLPINHTVVVKDSLLHADPTLAPRIFGAFKEAKAPS